MFSKLFQKTCFLLLAIVIIGTVGTMAQEETREVWITVSPLSGLIPTASTAISVNGSLCGDVPATIEAKPGDLIRLDRNEDRCYLYYLYTNESSLHWEIRGNLYYVNDVLYGMRISSPGDMEKQHVSYEKIQYVQIETRLNSELAAKMSAQLPNLKIVINYLDEGEKLQHLAQFRNLMVLDLGYLGDGDKELTYLKNLTELEILFINGIRVTDAGLSHCQSLTKLRMLSCPYMDDGWLANIKLPNLQILHISIIDLGDEQDYLKNFPKLHTLNCRRYITRHNINAMKNLRSLAVTEVKDINIDQLLAQMKDFTNLCYLHLDFSDISDSGISHLKNLSNLRTLYVGVLKPREFTNASLSYLSHLSNLQSLSLVMNFQNYELDTAHLAKLQNLRKLELAGIRMFDDVSMEHLSVLGNLRQLKISSSDLPESALQHLSKLSQLEVLSLDSIKKLEHLAKLTKLRTLDISFTNVCGEELVHLKSLTNLVTLFLDCHTGTRQVSGSLKNLPNLYFLSLANTDTKDADLADLAQLTNLRLLNLQNTQITDTGLLHLAKLPQLSALNVSECQITDQGVAHLASLQNLYSLNLRDTKITDASIPHLSKLSHLCILYLRGSQTSKSGEIGLAKLTQWRSLSINSPSVARELRESLPFPCCFIDSEDYESLISMAEAVDIGVVAILLAVLLFLWQWKKRAGKDIAQLSIGDITWLTFATTGAGIIGGGLYVQYFTDSFGMHHNPLPTFTLFPGFALSVLMTAVIGGGIVGTWNKRIGSGMGIAMAGISAVLFAGAWLIVFGRYLNQPDILTGVEIATSWEVGIAISGMLFYRHAKGFFGGLLCGLFIIGGLCVSVIAAENVFHIDRREYPMVMLIVLIIGTTLGAAIAATLIRGAAIAATLIRVVHLVRKKIFR
jgi:Leucine-rich repeat (LRR) protein